MDSDDTEGVRAALRAQGARIHGYEERLTSITRHLQEMANQLQNFQTLASEQLRSLNEVCHQLTGQVGSMSTVTSAPTATLPPAPASTPQPDPPPSPTTIPTPVLHLSKPARFSGDSESCRSFLVQCGLHFEMQAASFPTDCAKVAYMISHLSGRAEAWATAEWARNSPVCDSVDTFKEKLSKIFNQSTPGREAARALMGLRQGRRRVSDYVVEFRTLAVDSGWNNSSLCDAYLHGLTEALKDQLAPLELPEDLDSLISLTMKIDKKLFERERDRARSATPFSQRGPPVAASSL